MNGFDMMVLEALKAAYQAYASPSATDGADVLHVQSTGTGMFGDDWAGNCIGKGRSYPKICFSLGRLRKAGLIARVNIDDESYGLWKLTDDGEALLAKLTVGAA